MKTIFVVGVRGIPDVEGGVEKCAEQIFPRTVADGWRVVLMGTGKHVSSRNFKGVELWRTPAWRFLRTDKLLSYFCALFLAVRLRPDIVHLMGLGSALFLGIYKILGFKIVVRYGSADYLVPKWGRIGRFGFLVAEWQLRWADAIIVVTPALVQRLKAKGITKNIHLIPNAIDQIEALELQSDHKLYGPYILTVGRITPQKNFLPLVRAFSNLANAQPNMRLVIAGGVDDRDYMRQISPFLCDQITMTGQIPRAKLAALYEGAKLFINCSVHEGHSNAVLEAISWNCPILLSDIPENRDLELGATHYFDPHSSKSIESAIARVLASPARHRVAKTKFLNWDQVAAKTAQIYDDLLTNSTSKYHAEYRT